MAEFNPSYIGLRMDLIDLIKGVELKILDVGCASGVNAKYLLEKNIASQVYGIEFDELMAIEAENWNTKTFKGDLNLDCFRQEILENASGFDYIIFGDILEHLYDPSVVLQDFKKCLAQDGKIIISLPNIAHIELFIQIFIKGRWPLNDRGIFDKTHLRWFTKRDAYKMIENCGFEVLIYKPKLRARDAIGSTFDWKTNILKWLNNDWVTFQHLFICKHAK
jgi:2-polyprenyl-3-methyl-5-hydroxy-6-metoxy-1,4-benzoquinol methylase